MVMVMKECVVNLFLSICESKRFTKTRVVLIGYEKMFEDLFEKEKMRGNELFNDFRFLFFFMDSLCPLPLPSEHFLSKM